MAEKATWKEVNSNSWRFAIGNPAIKAAVFRYGWYDDRDHPPLFAVHLFGEEVKDGFKTVSAAKRFAILELRRRLTAALAMCP